VAVGLVLNRSRQVPAEETPAFAGIAERFRRAGELDRAVDLCRDGLKRFPRHLSARVTLGWALLDLGRYDEARAELEKVLKRAPDNLAAIRGLAELHERAETTVVMPLDATLSAQEGAASEPLLEVATTPSAALAVAPPETDAAPEAGNTVAELAIDEVVAAPITEAAAAGSLIDVDEGASAVDQAGAAPAAESAAVVPAAGAVASPPAPEASAPTEPVDTAALTATADAAATSSVAARDLAEPPPVGHTEPPADALQPTVDSGVLADLSESLASFEAAGGADAPEATGQTDDGPVLLAADDTDLSAFEMGAALALESLSADDAQPAVMLDQTAADESLLALDLEAAATTAEEQAVLLESTSVALGEPTMAGDLVQPEHQLAQTAEPTAVLETPGSAVESPAEHEGAFAHDLMLVDATVDLSEFAELESPEPVADAATSEDLPELSTFAIVEPFATPAEAAAEVLHTEEAAETALPEAEDAIPTEPPPVVVPLAALAAAKLATPQAGFVEAGPASPEAELVEPEASTGEAGETFVLTPWEVRADAADMLADDALDGADGLDNGLNPANLTFDFERPTAMEAQELTLAEPVVTAPIAPTPLAMLERFLRRVQARRLAASSEPLTS
jgi:Tetratricopeptide repeat